MGCIYTRSGRHSCYMRDLSLRYITCMSVVGIVYYIIVYCIIDSPTNPLTLTFNYLY